MTVLRARQETSRMISALPDNKIYQVHRFVQRLSRAEPKTRKRNDRQQALDELLALWKPADKEISLNGTKEVADALLARYEKSFS